MNVPPQDTTLRGARIMLAEDDADMRGIVAQRLRNDGAEVIECANGLALVEQLEETQVELLITDIRMPGVTGMEVLEGLNAFGRRCPVILITAFGDPQTHAEAHRLGASSVFDKPFDVSLLLSRSRDLVARARRITVALAALEARDR